MTQCEDVGGLWIGTAVCPPACICQVDTDCAPTGHQCMVNRCVGVGQNGADVFGCRVLPNDRLCDDNDICTADTCRPAGCEISPFLVYADVNNDAVVNVDDTLCLLDDFGGNPDSVPCQDAVTGASVPYQRRDISTCPSTDLQEADNPGFNIGDGFVATNDVLATVDVFGCACTNANLLFCGSCGLQTVCPACPSD